MYRLFVNCTQYGYNELGVEVEFGCLRSAKVENLVVALRLQYGHVVLLLVLTYLVRDAHALREKCQQLIVDLVDLTTQLGKALGRLGRFADNQMVENYSQSLGRNLLGLVTPCAVGSVVCLDHKAI